ncbi:hypothetical protein KY290_010579 [Solanum tuberosum]|uniref:Cytochrome P450 n=1 Tax=Solanum tuberosum TaxID=4113 RepID=A0ABQ7VY69_SOLTU|nr:hypothetical protein KY290_010579 [Solanum tuberosum]
MKLPPGPKGFPIIGILHMVLGKNLHQALHHIAKKHGPIMSMRFGVAPVIVASSPRAAEHFLIKNYIIFASRPYNTTAQRDMVFGKYGPHWRKMRKLCTLELLSNIKINSFRSMRKQELGIFVNFVKQAASNHVEVDLSAKFASLSANMSCLMVFGKKYMEEEFDERGFIARLKDLAKIFDEFFEKVIDDHVQLK